MEFEKFTKKFEDSLPLWYISLPFISWFTSGIGRFNMCGQQITFILYSFPDCPFCTSEKAVGSIKKSDFHIS